MIYITNNYYHWKGGATFEKFKNFKADKKYDAIIVGSSRAYRGYDPRIFKEYGYDAWNLGTGAQTIDNTYYIVKNYITPENCSLLIIDIYSGAFRNVGFESSSDLIQNVSSDEAAFEIACNAGDIRAANMLAVRFMTGSKQPMFLDKDYTGSGFSERHDTLPEELRNALLSEKSNALTKQENYEIKYLDLLLKFCNENKIKVVLTYAPTTDFYSEEIHADFLNEISKAIERNNTLLLDYSKKLKISTLEHFYDASHMNYEGVKLFNHALIQELREKELL